ARANERPSVLDSTYLRHQSPRCAVGPSRQKLYDALSEKALRCVVGPQVCDTEAAKKITTITTRSLVDNYGSTFKPITKVKEQFADLDDVFVSVLAVSIGEYDNRGQQGYCVCRRRSAAPCRSRSAALLTANPLRSGPPMALTTGGRSAHQHASLV